MGLNLVLPQVAGVFALPERWGDCFSGNNTFFPLILELIGVKLGAWGPPMAQVTFKSHFYRSWPTNKSPECSIINDGGGGGLLGGLFIYSLLNWKL